MRGRLGISGVMPAVIVSMLCCSGSSAQAIKRDAATLARDKARLDAAVKFAETVLEHGPDTYGKKHSPLIVDGLNVETMSYNAEKGLFVIDKRHLVANLDTREPLALITLAAALNGKLDKVPTYDGSGRFAWGRTAVLSGHSLPVPKSHDFRMLRPKPGTFLRWRDRSGRGNDALIGQGPPEVVTDGIGGKPAVKIAPGRGLVIRENPGLALKKMTVFLVWRSDRVDKREAIFMGQLPANMKGCIVWLTAADSVEKAK